MVFDRLFDSKGDFGTDVANNTLMKAHCFDRA